MITNSALTIYNKYYDSDTQTEKYQRFVLSAVEWEDRKDSNTLASGGRIDANQAVIYIPFPVGKLYYEKPKDWLALADKSANFTLQKGDLVVKGNILDELDEDFTASNLKAKYDDVLNITSVDTYDMGSFYLRHWKVGAN